MRHFCRRNIIPSFNFIGLDEVSRSRELHFLLVAKPNPMYRPVRTPVGLKGLNILVSQIYIEVETVSNKV